MNIVCVKAICDQVFEHYVDVRTCVATIVMMLVVRSKSAQTNNFDFLVCTTTAEPTTTVATTTAEPTTTVATTLGLCGRMTNEILWCIIVLTHVHHIRMTDAILHAHL